MNYYNENDPTAVLWLRELIRQKLIPNGHVDNRSIVEVSAGDLAGFVQHHFFAGLGGWCQALKLAGWPPDRPVWTGSCPCQPFSKAGRCLGTEDERHLWPVWFDLIAQCRPQFVFGEQVARAISVGWLDGIQTDLEDAGYACGSVILGAHSLRAPHIRQRIYWVAREAGLADPDRGRREQCHPHKRDLFFPYEDGHNGGVGLTNCKGLEGHGGDVPVVGQSGRVIPQSDGPASTPSAPWDAFEWLPCKDGRSRRIKPGVRVLAYGIPARVGRLRGYGNALVPPIAAEFIKTVCDLKSL